MGRILVCLDGVGVGRWCVVSEVVSLGGNMSSVSCGDGDGTGIEVGDVVVEWEEITIVLS